MIRLDGLTKEYGSFRALDNISITFEKGIYGILGPNGAGKSTLMKILTLVISPTSGEVFYDGKNVLDGSKKFLNKIGYVPQQQPIYANFTAKEFMYYISRLKGVDKNTARLQTKELLEFVHLSEVSEKKIGHLSGGMKQRLLLAQSLLGNPELILLDEPTVGVDPMERISIRNMIREIGKEKTVLITTHIISDIENITDGIVVMGKGKIVNSGTKEALLDRYEVSSLEEMYVEIFEVGACMDS